MEWLRGWGRYWGFLNTEFTPSRDILDYAVALQCAYDRVLEDHDIPRLDRHSPLVTLDEAVVQQLATYNQFARPEDYTDFVTDVRLMREQLLACPQSTTATIRRLVRLDVMPAPLRAAIRELPEFDSATLVVQPNYFNGVNSSVLGPSPTNTTAAGV
jgi:hypothetical protein